MARTLHILEDTALRAKDLPPGRLSDGGGLYLRVKKGGAKSWVFVHFKGAAKKRSWKEVGLGSYPAVKLRDARAAAEACRDRIRRDLDSVAPAQDDPKLANDLTFARCADEFIAEVGKGWSNPKHRAQWSMTLGDTYCRAIRSKPVSEVSTADVLTILKPVWQVKPETAQRLRGRIERVLDYAKANGHRSGENPALWRGHLQHLLAKKTKLVRGHHNAMPYADVPAFLEHLQAVEGMSALALDFLILTAARSGEVMGATWAEMDLGNKLWTVPPVRMKARKEHRVPLTDPALSILSRLYEARTCDYVFPGEPKAGKPRSLSVMAMTMSMRRLGVGHYTPHGFRSAFRDWAGDETSFPRELAEAALAHRTGDETERAYRRSDALEKRRLLMSAWSNYLTPRAGNVVALGR